MVNKTNISIILVSLTFMFLIGSCSSSKAEFTERISKLSKETLSKKDKAKEGHDELIALLGKSTAVFTAVMSKDVSQKALADINDSIVSQISDAQFFEKVLAAEKSQTLLQKNMELNQKKEMYLDSLVFVSVSDKDISNPLGKYLEVENFLVFQIDQWPSTDSNSQHSFLMKLRLIDTESGHVIWTGIAENRELNQEESTNIDRTALNLASKLAESFFHCFKKKWYRKRFDNLAKLST